MESIGTVVRTGVGAASAGDDFSRNRQGVSSSGEQKMSFPEGEGNWDRNDVLNAADLVNRTMEIYRTELRFVLDEESGEFMVKVINSTTGEVIREIPPEWVLKIVADVKKMLGIIIDKLI
ncbi:MAG: flagellar protein FlaG [Desulfotomaculales bacterium]